MNFQKTGLLIFLSLLLSCGGEGENTSEEKPRSPRIRKYIQFQSDFTDSYKLGESIPVSVTHREESSIDSISIRFGDFSSTVKGNTAQLETENMRVGRQTVSVTAYFAEDKETVTSSVTLVAPAAPTPYGYRIISTYPHDENAYTQGLFFAGDTLYESTGEKRRQNPESSSSVRKTLYQTGRILSKYDMRSEYFGEGMARWNNTLYQLTWTSGEVFTYNLNLEPGRTFRYATQTAEGWGLATYGDTLLMSDGSENLYFIDPRNFAELKRIQIYDDEGAVEYLNELEVIDGKLYANVYPDPEIVIINLSSGIVEGRIDFEGIVSENLSRNSDYAMNGIARHADGRIFVTGKWWPNLYEIVIFPKENL